MHSIIRKLSLAAGVGVLATTMLGLFSGPGETPNVFCPVDAETRKWKSFGASTCGGSACHAASSLADERPSTEYTTWQQKDAHAKAFNKLYDEVSTDMASELGIKEAHKDQKCLSCHSTNVPKEQHGDKYNIEDGVSCDACHGPAEGWFKVHAKPHDYNKMLTLGMTDTRNMFVRASMCVSCHMQIEPELVEAGHPDLSFELFAHSRREVPHWYERQTWDGVRAWTVGAAVSIAESLKKVKKRIDGKQGEEAIGNAAAQTTSYLNVFRHAVEIYGTDAEKALTTTLDDALNAETLDNAKLSPLCAKGANGMLEFAKRLSKTEKFSPENVKMLWTKIVGDAESLTGIDEYGAEQVAGAVYAIYNSIQTGKGPRLKTDIKTPKEIESLFVRPTVGLPEALFNEDYEFQDVEWNKRFKAVAALVK